ncbi:perlucin-like protein [Mytilus trossulus]|uniref:perlucin-like protein n=1 Tax=Mytilus trossulus TaxID=6551 RepID=UPI0030058531
MLFVVQFTLLVVVIKQASSQTCLSNESKDDFDKSRKSLTDVQENIGKVLNKLENDNKKTLDMFKETLNTMGQKIKKLDTDFKVLGKDFRKTKWHKYNGHCYYYSPDTADWFTAERKCRDIGGYVVKIDDKEENSNIAANKANSGYHYWIGLIDLKEGEWRWTYDQSKASFTTWYPGYGAKGTDSNCVMLHASRTDWFDYSCHYSAYYICESNFCF